MGWIGKEEIEETSLTEKAEKKRGGKCVAASEKSRSKIPNQTLGLEAS